MRRHHQTESATDSVVAGAPVVGNFSHGSNQLRSARGMAAAAAIPGQTGLYKPVDNLWEGCLLEPRVMPAILDEAGSHG